MTRAVILQPMYLPWAGYFGLIETADIFVYYDDVQFVRRSWQRRNRIKIPDGDFTWLTVTVEKDFAAIRITGGELQRQTGSVHRILGPLAEEHVYLHDVTTSATSVSILVEWEERDHALELLQEAF